MKTLQDFVLTGAKEHGWAKFARLALFGEAVWRSCNSRKGARRREKFSRSVRRRTLLGFSPCRHRRFTKGSRRGKGS